ncbi:MAG: TetR/AcrR family transcriptional regulator [Oscillospiraceae bacterium]|nr:TetR/AcrR family transcriptional regulator [Oscillospiraceae bacterium]
MAPRPRQSREQLLDAAFCILRTDGEEAVSIRAVAAAAGCSTQPVMSHFPTAAALKEALYEMADAFHSRYIMPENPQDDNPMLGIGLRYICFASEEPHLFRFLFQTNRLGTNFPALTRSDQLAPLYQILSREAGITETQAVEAFSAIYYVTHGIASLLANNAMLYDEAYCTGMLSAVFFGVIGAMKGGAA